MFHRRNWKVIIKATRKPIDLEKATNATKDFLYSAKWGATEYVLKCASCSETKRDIIYGDITIMEKENG